MKFATKIKYYDSLLNYSLKFANGQDLYRLTPQNNFKAKSQTAFTNIKQRILTRFLFFAILQNYYTAKCMTCVRQIRHHAWFLKISRSIISTEGLLLKFNADWRKRSAHFHLPVFIVFAENVVGRTHLQWVSKPGQVLQARFDEAPLARVDSFLAVSAFTPKDGIMITSHPRFQ